MTARLAASYSNTVMVESYSVAESHVSTNRLQPVYWSPLHACLTLKTNYTSGPRGKSEASSVGKICDVAAHVCGRDTWGALLAGSWLLVPCLLLHRCFSMAAQCPCIRARPAMTLCEPSKPPRQTRPSTPPHRPQPHLSASTWPYSLIGSECGVWPAGVTWSPEKVKLRSETSVLMVKGSLELTCVAATMMGFAAVSPTGCRWSRSATAKGAPL